MKVFFIRHGETLSNLKKIYYLTNNESITENGNNQASLAGKYLKTFGKFDLVISSPAIRCIDTEKIIINEINYKDNLIINNLIEEKINKKLKGLEGDELQNKFKKIKSKIPEKILEKIELYKNTNDPFIIKEISKKYSNKINKFYGYDVLFKKHIIEFLNYLKTLDKKCILVVTHGQHVQAITNIITNTEINYGMLKKTNFSILDKNYIGLPSEKIKPNGNTSVMACLLNNNKFELIIAPNTLHLS